MEQMQLKFRKIHANPSKNLHAAILTQLNRSSSQPINKSKMLSCPSCCLISTSHSVQCAHSLNYSQHTHLGSLHSSLLLHLHFCWTNSWHILHALMNICIIGSITVHSVKELNVRIGLSTYLCPLRLAPDERNSSEMSSHSMCQEHGV